jgi:HECT-domain (ubiquitin-transferase)
MLYDGLYHVQGADRVDLIPGGTEVKVNASNVYDYVRKYADYRMVKAVSKPLEVNRCFVQFFFVSLIVSDAPFELS